MYGADSRSRPLVSLGICGVEFPASGTTALVHLSHSFNPMNNSSHLNTHLPGKNSHLSSLTLQIYLRFLPDTFP
jgi:hypothetical protein